jgi:exopolyphosphatase / guanosine-5'-triphosphate,3'-diphosphate pyrophosphatase
MSIKAAIDIGTSSVKLLVLDVAVDGGYRILAEDSRVTSLGKGMAESGRLGANEIIATISCIGEMVERARALGAEAVRAAGTDALRRASNRMELLAPLAAAFALDVEILSGDDEARLSRAVALRELPDREGDVVFFDVGGGSTELTWCAGGEEREAVSLGLGARRCKELAGVTQPVAPAAQARLAELIDLELKNNAPGPQGGAVQLAGLGGTASQLVWALRGWRGEPKGEAHGAVVHAAVLREGLAQLALMPLDDVKQMTYMDPARAEIIYSGAAIIDGLLRFYGAPLFTVIDRGLRYGLILT